MNGGQGTSRPKLGPVPRKMVKFFLVSPKIKPSLISTLFLSKGLCDLCGLSLVLGSS